MTHRGRFQAQGKDLEASESWAQEIPLTVKDGLELLKKLEKSLGKGDRDLRKDACAKCRTYIQLLAKNGGWDASITGKTFLKSFTVKGQERVDLEIQTGIAFKK